MSQPMKYARFERERRFLLAALPAGSDPRSGDRELSDLYIEGTSLRLRLVTAPSGEAIERKLNQKRPDPDGRPERRVITSLYLEAEEYARLATLPGRRLSKRRYAYAEQGVRFGIDVFLGALAGLVLAEVARESDEALHAVPRPPFAHCEVTALPLFTGGELVRRDPAFVLSEARRLLGAPARW